MEKHLQLIPRRLVGRAPSHVAGQRAHRDITTFLLGNPRARAAKTYANFGVCWCNSATAAAVGPKISCNVIMVFSLVTRHAARVCAGAADLNNNMKFEFAAAAPNDDNV